MGAKVSCAQTGFVRKGLGARELRAGEACLCVDIVYAGAVCVDTVCARMPCAPTLPGALTPCAQRCRARANAGCGAGAC